MTDYSLGKSMVQKTPEKTPVHTRTISEKEKKRKYVLKSVWNRRAIMWRRLAKRILPENS